MCTETVQARQLRAGDYVRDGDGWCRVRRIEYDAGYVTLFDDDGREIAWLGHHQTAQRKRNDGPLFTQNREEADDATD